MQTRNLAGCLFAVCMASGCLSNADDLESAVEALSEGGGSLPAGRYSVRRNLVVDRSLQLPPGTMVELQQDRVLTFDTLPEAGRRQIFSGTGKVRFLRPGIVFPEWWGRGPDAIVNAIEASAQGSRIELAGRYDSVPLVLSLPGDEGKALSGTGGPGERFDDRTAGASIYLVEGSNSHVIRIEGNSQPADRAGIQLRNLKINGNGSRQKSGHCLSVSNVKDILIDNLFLEDCAEDGLNASERGVNQIEASYLEVQSAGRDGVSLGAAADSNFNVLKAGTNGRFGVQASGGSNQFGAVQVYLNGRDGLVASGDNKRFGVVRADENGEAGVRVTGSGNSFQVIEVADNGKAMSERPVMRAGLAIGGEAAWNHFGYIASRQRPGRAWQQSLVYLSSSGEQNYIADWRRPDPGQQLLAIDDKRSPYQALTMRQLGVQQLPAGRRLLIDPWLGSVARIAALEQPISVSIVPEALKLDGVRLTIMVEQGQAGTGRLRWAEDAGIGWQPDRRPGTLSSISMITLDGRWEVLARSPALRR